MKDTKNLVQRLKSQIAAAKEIDGDFAYITVGDAKRILKLLEEQPEIVRCKDCKWWDKKSKESPYGYCHACKHGHISEHWEIGIYRTYTGDWFCADGERRTE